MINVKFLNGHLPIQPIRKHQFYMQCVFYQFCASMCCLTKFIKLSSVIYKGNFIILC